MPTDQQPGGGGPPAVRGRGGRGQGVADAGVPDGGGAVRVAHLRRTVRQEDTHHPPQRGMLKGVPTVKSPKGHFFVTFKLPLSYFWVT